MDDLKSQVQALSADDWPAFYHWVVTTEHKRREDAQIAGPAVEQAQADLIGELVDSGVITGPDTTTVEEFAESREAPAWVNPGTDHSKMYRKGAVVSHAGKVWESVTPALNSWEPGTENGLTWVEVVLPDAEPVEGEEPAGETVSDFVQPTGAHDVYPLGGKVMFEGNVYESLVANNYYSPTAYPQGWRKL